MIVFVGAVVIGATGAFFSDTETSTGNTFTAGDIDLKIDNTSYVTDSTGTLVASTDTSWDLRDLTFERFFDFLDLKPGDIGEDTISIHVGSNDAWLCAAARITSDVDNGITEPEEEDGDVDLNNDNLGDDANNGELDEKVNFAFWVDDGDNVFENQQGASGTPEVIFEGGPLSGLGAQGKIAIADTDGSVLPSSGPVPGDSTFYIGKAWCFGTLTPVSTRQDGFGNTTPLSRGTTGFHCDGTDVDNQSQTDMVVGDLQFYAEQSRNNSEFTCAEDYTPDWGD